MDKKLNSESNLTKAHIGIYEGSEITLRRISDEANVRQGISQISGLPFRFEIYHLS